MDQEIDESYRVTPWKSVEEWKGVKTSLVSGQLQFAKEWMDIWKARTHKLDAGK